jgi:phospholipid/cholesterol/gamma-HCH transport system substrate-binding protein
MSIRNDIKLPVDSSVLVTQAGFLGGQYLSITPGGDDKMMSAGSFFENAQGSIDVMGLVNRFTGGGGAAPAAPQAPQAQPKATQPPAALPPTTSPQGPVKAPDPGAGP